MTVRIQTRALDVRIWRRLIVDTSAVRAAAIGPTRDSLSGVAERGELLIVEPIIAVLVPLAHLIPGKPLVLIAG